LKYTHIFRFTNKTVRTLTRVLEIHVGRNTPTPWNTPTPSGLRIRPLEHSHVCLKYTLEEIHLHLEIHPHLQVLKNKAVRTLTRVLEIHVARNTPTPWNKPIPSGLRIRPLENSHVCLKYTLEEIHLHLEIHPHLQVLKNKAVRKLTRVLEIYIARNTPTHWNTPTLSGFKEQGR